MSIHDIDSPDLVDCHVKGKDFEGIVVAHEDDYIDVKTTDGKIFRMMNPYVTGYSSGLEGGELVQTTEVKLKWNGSLQ